ncbi:MAG: tripartite tricarboxylate transporter substrate binding protein [Alphaproteobacteria bacterium]|nr:tripartite tricarboxylate transporter substrate binding protein [Alphaproteobacteria bacterium]
MSLLRRRAVLAGGVAASLGAPAIVRAQGASWPSGAIRFVVPFPPGGSTDPITRIIQAKLTETLGWNVVVENKPGGSGVVGAAVAAKAAPDGQTWLFVFDNHILNPVWNASLPYRDEELMPVMQIGRSAQGIAAHPTRPYNTFAEVIAAAKKAPGKISVGALGASLAQIFLAFLQKENGVELNVVPYKGGGPLFQDALGGVTDLSISSLANMMPHVRAGKLKLVGVTGDKRSKLAPDVATLGEQGVKALASYSWWGVYAPAGTPAPIVERMHAEIAKAVRAPDVTQKFVEQFDMEVVLNSPAEFAALTRREQEFWGKVIRDNKLKPD